MRAIAMLALWTLREDLLAGSYLQAGETPIQYLDPAWPDLSLNSQLCGLIQPLFPLTNREAMLAFDGVISPMPKPNANCL